MVMTVAVMLPGEGFRVMYNTCTDKRPPFGAALETGLWVQGN